MKKYLLNCFILLIPLFLWNLALVDSLPEAYNPETFWRDIPNWIGCSENVLRIVVFGIPLVMVFSLKTRLQKVGFGIYLVGILVYFLSWIFVIVSPESNWTTSSIGFMAPAYTTIVFFVGIGLIGSKAFFNFPYLSSIYITSSVLFTLIHTTHTFLVFQRL